MLIFIFLFVGSVLELWWHTDQDRTQRFMYKKKTWRKEKTENIYIFLVLSIAYGQQENL